MKFNKTRAYAGNLPVTKVFQIIAENADEARLLTAFATELQFKGIELPAHLQETIDALRAVGETEAVLLADYFGVGSTVICNRLAQLHRMGFVERRRCTDGRSGKRFLWSAADVEFDGS